MVEPVNLWLVAVVFLVAIVVMQASRIRRLRREHEELARVVKREADEHGEQYMVDMARKHGYPSKWDTEQVDSVEGGWW